MKKTLLLLFVVCHISLATAQTDNASFLGDDEKPKTSGKKKKKAKEKKEKTKKDPTERSSLSDLLYFGGGLDLQFGTLQSLGISPLAGVKIGEAFSLGVQFNYQSVTDKSRLFSQNVVTYNVIGFRGFARYKISSSVFAEAEYETLSYKFNGVEQSSFPAFLIGGGYNEPVGGGAALYALVLYNLDYSANTSFYNNPLVTRIGITYNF